MRMTSDNKPAFDWSEQEVLITGGTGSLGKTITRILLNEYKPHGIRIYSRDELKQWEFKNELAREGLDKNISFLIGDVRDKERLDRAMKRVTIVFNAAAMKHVPACEDNPFEAVKTNINGAQNIINCAIDNGVSRVMHISTDKCVYPVNLYGATKTVAEKLFLHGNIYSGGHVTRISACRYGNVIGSRGSIIPLFLNQAKTGTVTLTDRDMTRFWITLDQVARFIIKKAEITTGNELFIPLMPSIKIIDLIEAMFPFEANCPVIKIKEIGIRKGEKLHECLMTSEESYYSQIIKDDSIVVRQNGTRTTIEPWIYSSDKNLFLTIDQIKDLIRPFMESANVSR